MNTATSRAIAAPLFAVLVAWALVMLAQYTDLFVEDVFDDGNRVGSDPAVALSTYLVVLAVAVVAIAALWSQRVAIAQRISHGPDSRPERAAHRFATLVLIISMALSAILAISTFLQGFGRPDQRTDLLVRFGNVYAPILLYTALVITVLLVGFVFRHDSLPKSSDSSADEAKTTPTSDDSGDAVDEGASSGVGRRDLSASYAIPIVATAIALIVGLIVYDATGNALEVWVWVGIQFLIGVGIVAGTVYGERAIAGGPDGTSSRSRITRGARSLSFVLSIVFAATVGIMGFGYGSSAVDSLRSQPYLSIDIFSAPNTAQNQVEVGINAWDLQEGSAVTLTLEPGGTALLQDTVSDDEYFYESTTLGGNLEAGAYSLVAEATSEDGRTLNRTFDFSVNDAGAVSWDPEKEFSDQWSEDNTVIVQPDAKWWLEELLPAVMLVLLSVSVVFLSITRRNDPVTLAA